MAAQRSRTTGLDGAYVLCTDGSELAHRALENGIALLKPGPAVLIVTVVEPSDPTLLTGTGIAGGTMSPEAFDELERQAEAEGDAIVKSAAARLGTDGLETLVLRGGPGDSVCDLARELDATAIVLGTRGRGGLKRALLGSVSDYVVRNAPCPVIIVGESASTVR
jgi:nucleotide-binding universal stress UspA family protein